jgi:hypothetical protein
MMTLRSVSHTNCCGTCGIWLICIRIAIQVYPRSAARGLSWLTGSHVLPTSLPAMVAELGNHDRSSKGTAANLWKKSSLECVRYIVGCEVFSESQLSVVCPRPLPSAVPSDPSHPRLMLVHRFNLPRRRKPRPSPLKVRSNSHPRYIHSATDGPAYYSAQNLLIWRNLSPFRHYG